MNGRRMLKIDLPRCAGASVASVAPVYVLTLSEDERAALRGELQALALRGVRLTAHLHELFDTLRSWGHESPALEEPAATPPQCRFCRGTGRNPLSDTLNWLSCGMCHGTGRAPASSAGVPW